MPQPLSTLAAAVLPMAMATSWLTADGGGHAKGPGQKTITYGAARVTVPGNWPVHDLGTDPTTCVRFDRNAVYLGHPSAEQQCPAHLVGHADALLLEPGTPGTRSASPQTMIDPTAHVIERQLPGGIRISATYGDDEATAKALVAGATTTGKVTRQGETATTTTLDLAEVEPTADESPIKAGTPLLRTPSLFNGPGFDTCAAPAAATMRSWLASPYRGIGVYVGGANRACGDGNLSSGWVHQVSGEGWHLMPIYVGLQAPCVLQGHLQHLDPAHAVQQGTAAANDAADRAGRFAMMPGSAIYFDLEAYRHEDALCRAGVLTFLAAWTSGLHARGYRAGVYSSASSGIHDLADNYNVPGTVRVDAIWLARWNNKPQVYGDPAVADTEWYPHQRVKQYHGGRKETYGGKSIDVDSDTIDAPLALIG